MQIKAQVFDIHVFFFFGPNAQVVSQRLWWKMPTGPRPEDHAVQSKRKWEAAMMLWRNELKRLRSEAKANKRSSGVHA